jgi:peptidoglycan/LPS O-acetylase OafA/YrhL
VWLGTRVRRDPSRLDTALVGAAVLSLVASPHAYPDDLVMLAPVFVIGVAAAARRMSASASSRFASPLAYAYGAWALITVAACVDLIDAAAFPPGQLAGWALVLAAVLAGIATWRKGDLPGVPRLRVAHFGRAQTRS